MAKTNRERKLTQREKDQILGALCDVMCENGYDVMPEDILKDTRKQPIPVVRGMFGFIAWNHYEVGTSDIGRAIGRDHSTVTHGNLRAVNAIETDYDHAQLYLQTIERLGIHKPGWLHPKMERVLKIKHKPSSLKIGKDADPELSGPFVKPMLYTQKELRERREWLRRGGEFRK
ncbi:MAG TPA: helix-turn-helix domain-containing protein [Flavobacteriales bacterium]|nr:helix-turn-helix domain-containing protein [Flavobacteriales bacterium]